jgi:hypothetical protein
MHDLFPHVAATVAVHTAGGDLDQRRIDRAQTMSKLPFEENQTVLASLRSRVARKSIVSKLRFSPKNFA